MKALKKFIALALIIALAAFAAPALAKDYSGDWSSEDNNTLNSDKNINITSGNTLKIGSTAVEGDGSVTITGEGTLIGGNIYGVAKMENISLDAQQPLDNGEGTKSPNMNIAPAPKKDSGDNDTNTYSLVMNNVQASPAINTVKQYVKVAGQLVNDAKFTGESVIEATNITITNSVIGHSVFAGPMAISAGEGTNLTINNATVTLGAGTHVVRAVYGGGGSWSKNANTHVGKATIIIDGAKITQDGAGLVADEGENKFTEQGFVYGGGMVENKGTDKATVKEVEIIIKSGQVDHVRGGARYEGTTSVSENDVETVSIVIDGDSGLKAVTEDVYAGGDFADNSTETNEEVAPSVKSATITVQNISAETTSDADISGDGASTTAVNLLNVKGTLGEVDNVSSVGVDPNTSATLYDLIGKDDTTQPEVELVGDWRNESGVQEFNLNEMIKVKGETADTLFSNAANPKYDPAKTGITSLTRNADGSFRATVERTGSSGGSGGGCSAGFGALALLAALPLLRMRKK